jgi:hypothetical protein
MIRIPPTAGLPPGVRRLPAVTSEFLKQAEAFLRKARAFHKENAAAIAECERDYLPMSLDALEKLLAKELTLLPIEYPKPMFISYTNGPPTKVRFAPGTQGFDCRKNGRGIRGRYVRVHTHGSTTDEFNRFTEIEVWGRRV